MGKHANPVSGERAASGSAPEPAQLALACRVLAMKILPV
jgi:hypothetical protein